MGYLFWDMISNHILILKRYPLISWSILTYPIISQHIPRYPRGRTPRCRRPSGPPVSLRFHWRPLAFPGLPRALAHLCACVLRPASLCARPLSTGIRALCQFQALGEMFLCADCSRLQRGLKKCSLHADCSDDPLRWAHPR